MTTERPLADDTPLDVERLQIERWQQTTPAEKFAAMSGLHAGLVRLAEASLRSEYPAATPRALFLRRAARTVDRETMIAACGWDPVEHP